jgi:magnesium chelatase family protein
VTSRALGASDTKNCRQFHSGGIARGATHFDLEIAVAIPPGLTGRRPRDGAEPAWTGWCTWASWGSTGRIRPVCGVLPTVAAAVAAGFPDVVVAAVDADEAQLVPDARVVGAASLAEVVALHGGLLELVREVVAVRPVCFSRA